MPQPRDQAWKQLDNLLSMSVSDIDQERLANAYLTALVRLVEPEESPQGDAGVHVGPEMAGGSREH